jgi:transposase
VDAIRHLVDNGCKWRALPADFLPWRTVYGFFRRWTATGALVLVTPADVQDRGAAKDLLTRLKLTHPEIVQVWADSGYAGQLVDWARDKPESPSGSPRSRQTRPVSRS